MKISVNTLLIAPPGSTLSRASKDGDSILTWTKKKAGIGWVENGKPEYSFVSSHSLHWMISHMGGTWMLTLTEGD